MSNQKVFTKADFITVLTAASNDRDDVERRLNEAESRYQIAENQLKGQQNIASKADDDYGLLGFVAKLIFDTSYSYLTADLEGETLKENTVEVSKRVVVLGGCAAAVVGILSLVAGSADK